MSEREKVDVIFRKFKDNGAIIALFPYVEASYSGVECSSYMHIGQHGPANYNLLIPVTELAKPKEYKSLQRELENIGYDLTIKKKRMYRKSFLG